MITFYRVKSCVNLNWVHRSNSVTKIASRQCKTSPDCFCYVCGYYISGQHPSHKIVEGTKYWTAYRQYFGIGISDQDKSWAPHVICGCCRSILEGWLRGSGRLSSFAVLSVWREPKNHHDDYYCCMIKISKYRKVKERIAITYPSIFSFIAPVPHSDALPVPKAHHQMWVIFCG